MADSEGNYVKALGSGSYVTVNGLATSTVYIVLVSEDKLEFSTVPSVTYSFTASTTYDDTSVTVEGDASGTAEKQTVSVSQTGSSVSGTGADNNAKGISNVFYGLIVLMIILFLVFLWAASKRGVFSRN